MFRSESDSKQLEKLQVAWQFCIDQPRWPVLAAAVGLWLVGQLAGIWLLFLPTAMLLALLALAYGWPRWQLRQIHILRQTPNTWRTGQSARLTFQLHSRWPLWQLRLTQPLPCGDLQNTPPLGVPFLFGRQTVTLDLRPAQSGRFHLNCVEVSCAFPFGLWPARRHITLPATELWVHPPIIRWRHIPSVIGQLPGAGSPHPSQTGHGEYFYQMRDYVAGDDTALIDWKSSAKTGQWRVKCFTPEAQPRVLLALDTRPGFHLGTGSQSTLATQQRLAASLARHWCAKGSEVWCLTEHGCRKLPAFNQHFEPFDDFLICLPQAGQRGANELLQEYAPRSASQLWVQFALRGSAQMPVLPDGVQLWNFLLDEASFNHPLVLQRLQIPRRESYIWDFHLHANMPWEQLFDAAL